MSMLIYKPGTSSERRFALRVGLNTVGRNRDNAVWLNRADVSRYHAEIAVTPERVILKDLGSSNHCFVNGRKVKLTELSDGDEVRFSSIRLVFQAQDEPASSTVNESDLDEAATLAADIAQHGRVEDGVTPERRAELAEQLAGLSPSSAEPASLLKIPEHWTGDRRLARLKILLETANRLAEPSGVAVRMERALDVVMQFLDVDRAAILEERAVAGQSSHPAVGADPVRAAPKSAPRLRLVATRNRLGTAAGEDGAFYDPAFVAAALAKGGPSLRVESAVDSTSAVHVACAVPLGSVAADAALYVDSVHAPTGYAEDDVSLIAELAAQLGIALANARALDELRADDVAILSAEPLIAEELVAAALPDTPAAAADSAEADDILAALSALDEQGKP